MNLSLHSKALSNYTNFIEEFKPGLFKMNLTGCIQNKVYKTKKQSEI